MVDAVGLGDHDHAPFADGEAAGPVVLVVVADLGARRDVHALVDDRPADLGVAADVDAVEAGSNPATWAKLLTRVLVPRIDRSTVPPETIEPWQTMLSSAWPRRALRPSSANTNFGGGKFG